MIGRLIKDGTIERTFACGSFDVDVTMRAPTTHEQLCFFAKTGESSATEMISAARYSCGSFIQTIKVSTESECENMDVLANGEINLAAPSMIAFFIGLFKFCCENLDFEDDKKKSKQLQRRGEMGEVAKPVHIKTKKKNARKRKSGKGRG